MNDRFKFRVWDVQNQEYIYFDLINKDGLSDFAYFANEVTPDYNEQVRCPDTNCWALIIEQCTGLKDKNGKLIYEGDIITRKGIYRRVFWIDEEGGFGYEPSTLFEPLQTETCKIAGNIHENGDLLK